MSRLEIEPRSKLHKVETNMSAGKSEDERMNFGLTKVWRTHKCPDISYFFLERSGQRRFYQRWPGLILIQFETLVGEPLIQTQSLA